MGKPNSMINRIARPVRVERQPAEVKHLSKRWNRKNTELLELWVRPIGPTIRTAQIPLVGATEKGIAQSTSFLVSSKEVQSKV